MSQVNVDRQYKTHFCIEKKLYFSIFENIHFFDAHLKRFAEIFQTYRPTRYLGTFCLSRATCTEESA